MDWDSVVSQILMRAADGVVSDEDVAYILSILPTGDTNLKEWLQDLVDRVGAENVQLLMALYMLYQMRKKG